MPRQHINPQNINPQSDREGYQPPKEKPGFEEEAPTMKKSPLGKDNGEKAPSNDCPVTNAQQDTVTNKDTKKGSCGC